MRNINSVTLWKERFKSVIVESGVAARTMAAFDHLFDLDQRGVWWVTRSKDKMKYRAVKNHPTNDENTRSALSNDPRRRS
jgi:hypothetical protein